MEIKLSTADNIPYDKLFKIVTRRIAEIFHINLSYMKLKFSSVPLHKDGTEYKELSPNKYGGCWTRNKEIYLNPDHQSVMEYYFDKINFSTEEIIDFIKTIIAHELGHEIYANDKEKSFPRKMVKEAKNRQFTTAYLEKSESVDNEEELFCEYLAHIVTRGKLNVLPRDGQKT